MDHQKKERVMSLKQKWSQDLATAKIEHQQMKYKKIQELRSQNVIYYYEASLNTQRKEDLKKLVQIDNSKIAALLDIDKEQPENHQNVSAFFVGFEIL